jgi:hypothetical protein
MLQRYEQKSRALFSISLFLLTISHSYMRFFINSIPDISSDHSQLLLNIPEKPSKSMRFIAEKQSTFAVLKIIIHQLPEHKH